eukprot:3966849-Prymnesium_polylepis.1
MAAMRVLVYGIDGTHLTTLKPPNVVRRASARRRTPTAAMPRAARCMPHAARRTPQPHAALI